MEIKLKKEYDYFYSSEGIIDGFAFCASGLERIGDVQGESCTLSVVPCKTPGYRKISLRKSGKAAASAEFRVKAVHEANKTLFNSLNLSSYNLSESVKGLAGKVNFSGSVEKWQKLADLMKEP